MKRLITLLILFISISFDALSQNGVCKVIGEISLPAVEAGAFLGCMSSANQLVCELAFAAHNCAQDISCSGVVSTLVEGGCEFSIVKTNGMIKIIGTSSEEAKASLVHTYEMLNSIEGIHWVMINLNK